MVALIGIVVAVFFFAGLVLLVKWFQRCPRCKSLWGPTGVRGWLLPNDGYKVKRRCRGCGHVWEEETKFEPMTP
ncbi:MAG TPA: hypothetical protein PKA08_08600 [Elusimicrobiota bacterium]|nr:hypothetical protein [Elusimicrobiota bacterium]